MTEENKNMDGAFKKASEEMKIPYDASFWDAAKSKLDDASLDDAFIAAAGASFSAPSMENTESVDDLFMDSAFVEASAESAVAYDASFYEQFTASEANTLMDEAFQTAAAAAVVDYLPKYWSAADKVLIAEGLHYEYNTNYWTDAKRLLDRSDRKVFFARWSAIAAVLLLISFSGSLIGLNNFSGERQLREFASDRPSEKSQALNQLVANNNDLADNENVSTSGLDEINNQMLTTVNVDLNSSNPTANYAITNENSLTGVNTNSTNTVNAPLLVIANNQSINGTGTALNMAELKVPIISVASPELSPRVYQIDSRTYINKIPVRPYDDRDLSVSVPLMEINKGQDKPRNMHSVAVLAQIGVGNRWGTTKLLPSLRSGLGVDYTLSGSGLLKNIEFNTNFMLNHVRQNNLGFEDRSTEYNSQGGFYNYWRKIQYKDTWMANLNANVNFRLAPRHKVRLGAGLEYLVGVRSNMSFRDSKISDIEIVNNNWGVKQGITKLDFKISVGYDFQLTNSLALQLTGNYGLRDRTDDTFLKEPIILDREMNIMIGVKYTLFRKL